MKRFLLFFGLLLLFSFSIYSENGYAIENGGAGFSDGKGFVPPNPDDIDDGLCKTGFRDCVKSVINYFLTFVGIISVAAIIYYGFLWITSLGNEEQLETGKKGVIYVALGILLILFSWVLVDFFIRAGGNPQEANAKSVSIVSQQEEQIYKRLEVMKGKIKNTYNFDLNTLYDIESDYNALFDELPQTQTVEAFRYHFYEGDLYVVNSAFQDALLNLRSLMEEQETVDDEKSDAQKEREIKSARKSVEKSIGVILQKIKKIPRMQARIKLNPDNGSVPLTVTLNGLESSDPTKKTIPSANYQWSYLDYNGVEKNLGTGPHKVVTFQHPGNYVIRLEVFSFAEKSVLPGITTENVIVGPPELTADFLVEGKTVGSVLKVPLQDAKKGIRFDPQKTIVPEGVSIIEYIWDFNGEKQSTNTESDSVTHSFLKKGQYSVVLRVKDNIGNKSEKKLKINVEDSIAVIDIETVKPLVGDIVVFNGERSSLNGLPVSRYKWRIIDSQGNPIKEITDKPQFAYKFEEVGMYEIQLDIGNGISSTEQLEIASKPPVVNFSYTQENPARPAEVIFDATKSYDPFGEELFYSWDFEGDGEFDVRNVTTPIVHHTYTEKKTFFPRLIVSNHYTQSKQEQKEIQITSLFFADFLADSFVIQKGEELNFRIQTNTGTRFQWDFGDGQQEEDASVFQKHKYDQPGKHSVTLTAFNGDGEKITITKNVYVGDGEHPLAVASVSKDGVQIKKTQNVCQSGESAFVVNRYDILDFSGKDSINKDGKSENLRYKWSFSSGESIDEVDTKKSFMQISDEGECQRVLLTVTDVTTGTSVESDPIFVSVQNTSPTFTELLVQAPQQPCLSPCSVSVTMKGANDPDGTLQEYRWWAKMEGGIEKIDLHSSVEPSTTITLPPRGPKGKKNIFTIHSEIVDNDGGKTLSDTLLKTPPVVTVENNENPSHSVDFSMKRTIVSVGDEITFTAEVVNPLGDVIPNSAFRWDFDGDGVVDDQESGPTATHTYNQTGEYNVELLVQHRGNSSKKTHTVYVVEEKELPFADFSFSSKGLSVHLDAGISEYDQTIPDNELTYVWDVNGEQDSDLDGNASNDVDAKGEVVDYIFPKKGEYSVQLTVTNSAGIESIRVQKLQVGASQEGLSDHDTIRRSIRLQGDAPMATLEIVSRFSVDSPESPIEIIAYGFDTDRGFLRGDALFEIVSGGGSFSEDRIAFDRGRTSSFYLPDTKNSDPVTIKVSAQTVVGLISETIDF